MGQYTTTGQHISSSPHPTLQHCRGLSLPTHVAIGPNQPDPQSFTHLTSRQSMPYPACSSADAARSSE